MDDDKFLPKLSQNLLEILDDDEFYDITIEVGIDPYVKIFRAHMNILNYRSPYLRKIISTNKKKSDGTLAHIKLQSILPEIFQIILRYIYGGRVSFEGHDEADVIKTLVAASELDLQELVNHLQSFLIEKHSTWMEQNFNMIYQTSFENDSLLELQNYCNDLISKNPDKIFNSLNFSSIPEKILISLIQNDNLKMNEVQVWKYVLKWGLDQNPGLPSDHKSFSGDDFSVLKNTLQQYISLIKFDNFSSKEFLDHVFPYREILPEKLFIDLLILFLDYDNKPTDQSEPAQTFEKIETQSTSTTLGKS
ncbi:BTB/POZ domain-containing protein [Rhizophagus irregularis DAOM 181602=DAOM 197198]|uniref:BTB/POZ domain-containing protein n=1 Tax=Rhizophagus irregularis (strain DAOM 181602 / DAOM 197198 / MUCL 43194) TaxID=747089 RepID=A0A2P4Q704_RHIID|nr:BTB/POZ domain-containing protein [Rhizophagus irregularis DAOM 181602=DAOM 197198]POG73404.1 BTB/POZ domain-containing protein [Rhizophagus irregularis DAOM 181602=DAOM 197198]|eukprot:XP_025180270.1 BTB/POZ domain-containing protein [Rhizophagus irregularis DAOM 181602=DAOM 197198]